MKKIFFALAFIAVLIYTGMQSATAQQGKIHVWWQASCPDTCTSTQVCAYLVEVTVINYCVNPPVIQCYDSQWVNCSTLSVDFPPCECEDATSNPCFYILGRATKYCSWPGNQIVKCTGTGYNTASCWQMMNQTIPVEIIWQ